MKKGTKEYYEIREQFEKDLQKLPIYVSSDITRDDSTSPDFYENGEINKLFIVYMAGYGLGRLNYM